MMENGIYLGGTTFSIRAQHIVELGILLVRGHLDLEDRCGVSALAACNGSGVPAVAVGTSDIHSRIITVGVEDVLADILRRGEAGCDGFGRPLTLAGVGQVERGFFDLRYADVVGHVLEEVANRRVTAVTVVPLE